MIDKKIDYEPLKDLVNDLGLSFARIARRGNIPVQSLQRCIRLGIPIPITWIPALQHLLGWTSLTEVYYFLLNEPYLDDDAAQQSSPPVDIAGTLRSLADVIEARAF